MDASAMLEQHATFAAAAVALLSKYSNNLLREESEAALSGKLLGNELEAERIVKTILNFIDAFEEKEYLVRGIYRVSGSLAIQQNALNIIEGAKGTPLKICFILELTTEDKANCIKTLLRKMPDTLFPRSQRAAMLDIAETAKHLDENGDNERLFKALQILVYFLPDSHKRCLEALLTHLAKVIEHSAVNKMDCNNLSLMLCHYIFPMANDSVQELKEEIECFGRLFPFLIRHSQELFRPSHELFETMEHSLLKRSAERQSFLNGTYSPLLQTPPRLTPDDPEVSLLQSSSQRVLTPTRSTTEIETAKLAAQIVSMSEGPTKKRLLKRLQEEQREKLGIKKQSLLKRAFSKTPPRK